MGTIINYTLTIKLLPRETQVGKQTLAWKSRLWFLPLGLSAALTCQLASCLFPQNRKNLIIACLPKRWSGPDFRSLRSWGNLSLVTSTVATANLTRHLNPSQSADLISQGLQTPFALFCPQHLEIHASKTWVHI